MGWQQSDIFIIISENILTENEYKIQTKCTQKLNNNRNQRPHLCCAPSFSCIIVYIGINNYLKSKNLVKRENYHNLNWQNCT